VMQTSGTPTRPGKGKAALIVTGAALLAVVGALMAWQVRLRSGQVGPTRPQPNGAEAARTQLPIPADLGSGIRMEFVRIRPGEFMMGCSSSEGECERGEEPLHQVRITRAFELGKYEVTQAQWEVLMGDNPSEFKGEDRPVERVSWNRVQEFLNKLNARMDGHRYRLPTEAEWEYAARAGSTSAPQRALRDIAWFADNSGREVRDAEAFWDALAERNERVRFTEWLKTNQNQTHPVGQKQPSAWGLYDMHGNVSEWCQDWYETYYQDGPSHDPLGPSQGSFKVMRGGSWDDTASLLRSTYRRRDTPAFWLNNIGFRCAREPIR
jgi:formylglycine-generating enzyme required for sulfatase activity